ncbi:MULTISPECIES: hypothetical protein [unclassified Streptomyces]|uniref:hypothetical protein n=1 Tax=unclassified Streptomyces TaxID=2593676 RepID=UPI0022591565|nr:MULTISPECIES: hypothetical protein [unclassified Streptomyces]MCX4525922.1 hypothetical protein [Streptomyces sp. NBC_01551]MCX4543515.1 hypothetical protein [Streptomyces sp. NBC_01565]
MGDTLLALSVAIVGVTGTLFAPVLSHRLLARVQSDQFERQERMTNAQWLREQQAIELDKRRGCYVTANSGYRRYRVELMNYLWLVHKGETTAQGRADLGDARHAMHASFAEAQMVASDAVLEELDSLAQALAHAYDRVMRLEDGTPAPDGSFEDVQATLLRINDAWIVMRSAMRADLGLDSGAGGRSSVAPDDAPAAADLPAAAEER